MNNSVWQINMEAYMVEDQNNVVVKNRDIQHMIYNIRDKQVMIDSDLAMLYYRFTIDMSQ